MGGEGWRKRGGGYGGYEGWRRGVRGRGIRDVGGG